ncbi:MAG: hypothetical protein J7500_06890 [Sphingomonas sp.]|uniref:hypothetical protein n=1 Tax=Sphingomonas sp. TaxID=28214 RepID=UPI001B29C882|nr:hypothetical protein [Sphingomonas sp.]MBO9622420.1 hypothetical protein [Sphingomonas sp.]
MITAALAIMAALQARAIDWAALPPLPYRVPPVVTPDMHGFVAREVKARKCPVPAPAAPGARLQTLVVGVAVLVDEAGGIRTVVPRAIDCPTVEQFAAALAAGFARNNLLPRNASAPQWYRADLSFSWPR